MGADTIKQYAATIPEGFVQESSVPVSLEEPDLDNVGSPLSLSNEDLEWTDIDDKFSEIRHQQNRRYATNIPEGFVLQTDDIYGDFIGDTEMRQAPKLSIIDRAKTAFRDFMEGGEIGRKERTDLVYVLAKRNRIPANIVDENLNSILNNPKLSGIQKDIPEEMEGESAFAQSFGEALTFGAFDADPILKKQYPLHSVGGAISGGVASFLATGGVLTALGLGKVAFQAGQTGRVILASAPRFIPPAIMTGSTFATVSGIREAVKQVKDEKINPFKVGKEILVSFSEGATLGAVGQTVGYSRRVIMAAGLGYISGKAQGDTNEEAGIKGAIWAGIEAFGGIGRDEALKNRALTDVRDNLAKYTMTKNPSMKPDQAIKSADNYLNQMAKPLGGLKKAVKSTPIKFFEKASQLVDKMIKSFKGKASPDVLQEASKALAIASKGEIKPSAKAKVQPVSLEDIKDLSEIRDMMSYTDLTNQDLAKSGVNDKNYKDYLNPSKSTEVQYVAAKQIQLYLERGDLISIEKAQELYKSYQPAEGKVDPLIQEAKKGDWEGVGGDWVKDLRNLDAWNNPERLSRELKDMESDLKTSLPGNKELQRDIEIVKKRLVELKQTPQPKPDTPTEWKVEPQDVSFVKEILEEPVEKVGPQLTEQKGEVRIAGEQKEAKEIETAYEKQKDIWFGNKDVRITLEIPNEKSMLQKRIKSVAKTKEYGDLAKGYDMAIQLYIDSKRNPGQVEALYDTLPDEKKKLIDLSKNLPPEVQKIADDISKSYNQIGLEALEEDVIKNVLDNYASRIWDIKTKKGSERFRKFGTTTRHAKQRIFDTIVEGWSKGMDLKVKGATNNLSILKEEIVKTIEDKKFIKSLQKIRDIEGNPLLTTNQLEGYVPIEHPNFKTWRWAGKAEEGVSYGRNFFIDDEGNLFEKRSLYAPKEQAENLNNILGISKLKGIKAIDIATKYNAIIKAWILQTSLFHHFAFSRSYYLGTNRKTFKEMNIIDAVNDGNRMVEEMNPVIVQGVRNGLTLGKKQDWDEDLLGDKTFVENILNQTEATKVIKDKILKLRKDQADFLFNVMGTGLKSKAFSIEYRNQLKEYPNENPNDIAKRVANLINDDFGGLHLQRMGRNPTVQHIFRLLALAPDWTESNIRTMVKAFKAGKEGKTYRNFWAGVFAKGVTATILANLAMAAFDEDDEEGKGILGRFVRNYRIAGEEGKYRWLDVDITPLYKAFGGESKDRFYFSILGHFKDPLKFVVRNERSKEDGRLSTFKIGNTRAMKHKSSVLGRLFLDYMSGTDYAERRFTTIKELMGIDTEKGVYKTSRKGKYKKGDPKWGKLKGQTVVWDYNKRGSVELEQLPSFLINEAKGSQPIQVQNLIGWVAGELDGFIALSNSLGLGVSKTYGRDEEDKK